MKLGDCVKLPDGRLGRIRGIRKNKVRVRVRRARGMTHEFVLLSSASLQKINCPKGWMSPEGYRRYLKVTLRKMRERQNRRTRAPRAPRQRIPPG
jgi:hypothetical protein